MSTLPSTPCVCPTKAHTALKQAGVPSYTIHSIFPKGILGFSLLIKQTKLDWTPLCFSRSGFSPFSNIHGNFSSLHHGWNCFFSGGFYSHFFLKSSTNATSTYNSRHFYLLTCIYYDLLLLKAPLPFFSSFLVLLILCLIPNGLLLKLNSASWRQRLYLPLSAAAHQGTCTYQALIRRILFNWIEESEVILKYLVHILRLM